MKLTSFKLIIFATVTILFSSFQCSESDDTVSLWDFYPIELKMYVMAPDGSNLLDPRTENNLLDSDIKLIHNGTAYKLNYNYVNDDDKVATRVYLPTFYGLVLRKDKNGTPYLYVGEFDGGKDFENEIITLDWGDGTYNTVNFDSKLTWRKSEPIFFRNFYLDKDWTENPIKIYKK